MLQLRRFGAIVVGAYFGVAALSIIAQLIGVDRPIGLAMAAVGALIGAFAGWRDALGLKPQTPGEDRSTVLGWTIWIGLIVAVGGILLPSPWNVIVSLIGVGMIVWAGWLVLLDGWNAGSKP